MNVAVFMGLFAAFMGVGVVFLSIYAARASAKKTGGGK